MNERYNIQRYPDYASQASCCPNKTHIGHKNTQLKPNSAIIIIIIIPLIIHKDPPQGPLEVPAPHFENPWYKQVFPAATINPGLVFVPQKISGCINTHAQQSEKDLQDILKNESGTFFLSTLSHFNWRQQVTSLWMNK